MKRLLPLSTALVVAVVATVVTVSLVAAQEAGGLWHGEPPSALGVHLATWNGGTIEQAAATPGLRSLWMTVDGRLEGYVVGAPGFVNAGFRARFAEGVIPPGTALLVAIDATEDAVPEAVVEDFLAALELAAPPLASEPALVRALSRLTDASRARLASSGQLAAFLGVQDLPDAGAVLTVRTQTQAEVRVHALLRYSGGDAEREFLLLRERARWHVDWVDAHPLHAGSSPEQVVQAFLAHFIASAPPAATERPAVRASELLTDSTRAALRGDAPLASALAGLVGVQDVPDMGFEVAPATVNAEQATVTATLRYSGADATRTFNLVQGGTGWHIERIGQ